MFTERSVTHRPGEAASSGARGVSAGAGDFSGTNGGEEGVRNGGEQGGGGDNERRGGPNANHFGDGRRSSDPKIENEESDLKRFLSVHSLKQVIRNYLVFSE